VTSSVLTPEIEDVAGQRRRAIAHMNRGHAGLLEGSPGSLDTAIADYERAIVILTPAAPERDDAWRNSLAAAWINRGQLLHRRHGLDRAPAALQSFEAAEIILQSMPAGASPWPRRNLAGTLLNRACLHLDLNEPALASVDAERALAQVVPSERNDAVDAELALKARRAICDCIGRLIVVDGADQPALADAAIEHVEAGLELQRLWRQLRLTEAADRLYHFGAQLYRVHQPHFLGEFLLEHLDHGGPARRAIALASVTNALAAPLPVPRLVVGEPASERVRQTWRDLRAAQALLSPA
jgi:tetratricopeptide (TPR) repeat protein